MKSERGVTPIRQRPISEPIEKHIETTRQLIFDAIALIDIAAASALSESPPDEHSTHRSLRMLAKMLNEANERLDVVTLQRLSSGLPLRMELSL